VILDVYVKDGQRSGRPPKKEEEKEEVLELVSEDWNGRELSCEAIADWLGNRICAKTIWTILQEAGLSKTKPMRKPGLSEAMRTACLKWCLAYQHWSLKDWKNVIWSDKTLVVLCIRRGGYWVWRRSDEKVLKLTIRERWKGYSEFMFWACFSYREKGPCHVWRAETPSERIAAQEALDTLNAQNEPLAQAKWQADEDLRYAAACNRDF